MNAELYLVSTILVLAGLAVAAIGIAHHRGWLRRNFFVGLRGPATLTSDDAWKQAHDATSRATGIGGTLLVTLMKFSFPQFLNATKVAFKAFISRVPDPESLIDASVALANQARSNGLLALEDADVLSKLPPR